MTVRYDDAVLTPDTIAAAVQSAGYGASPAATGMRAQTQPERGKRRLILSFVFMAGVLACSMGGAVADPFVSGGVQAFFTALTVLVNRDCFIKGFKALFRGAPNMDSLIASGASAAVVYSVCVLCLTGGRGGLYFESAAMVLTLITLGRYLESRAKGKTAAALETAGRVTTVALDKTGTLTAGTPLCTRLKILTKSTVKGFAAKSTAFPVVPETRG